MGKCLIVFTRKYPYSYGEPSFQDEIPYHIPNFEKVIVLAQDINKGEPITRINSRDTITVLLAHIERYQNGKVMEQLQKEGVLMQASTGFFIRKRHTALRMLKNGRIHLLGTDSHNMDQRKPDFARAMEIINRKMDTQVLQGLAQMEVMVLDEMEKELDYM